MRSRRCRPALAASIAALSLVSLTARGDARSRDSMNQEPARDASTILARAIQTKGGLERLRSIKSVQMSGVMISSAVRVTVKTTSYIVYPDNFRMDAEMPRGDVTQVYAAGVTWMKDPTGVHDVPEGSREALRATVLRDVVSLLLAGAQSQAQVSLGGEQTLPDGRVVDVLQLWREAGTSVDLLVERATGLVAGKRYVVEQPGPIAKLPTEELYSDYRSVDGVQVAFKTIVRRGVATILEQTLSSLKINAPVDPKIFVRPLG